MSFGEIGQVIREEFGEEEIKPTLQQTKYSKALKLFKERKNFFEVAVDLHLTYDEVAKVHMDYLKLENCDKLNKIYEHLGDHIEPFIILHDKMKQAGKSPEDALVASDYIGNIQLLESRFNQRYTTVRQLEIKTDWLLQSCRNLQNKNNGLLYNNRMLKAQNNNEGMRNQVLLSERLRIQDEIRHFNSIGPSMIYDIAGKEIRSILSDKRKMLSLATTAVFQVVIQDPSKAYLLNAFSEIGRSDPLLQQDIEFHRAEFLDLAEKAYDNLSLQCTRSIANTILKKNTLTASKDY